jgi:asparagine synthase (glutamine-hydrolysing)
MCGLFASIGFEPNPARIDLVSYRGPDGRGWQVHPSEAGPVSLGHRRLAIIDTSSAGLQPMADPTGRFYLIFNGEIYNYLELRKELEVTGEIFLSHSDSEVLLRSFAVWGQECLPRLRGMFAFVIWDRIESRLFAARDRFGIKPLYYFEGERGVAFASEIKQLEGLPGWSGRMNIARVHDFLGSGMADHTSETMFAGVSQLRGGELAIVSTGAGAPPRAEIRRWYSLPTALLDVGEAEAAKRFRALLNESVRLHLRSDVTVGSCLSGGLDSSSIVSLMAQELGSATDINTVSACYPDKEVDEKPFMDEAIRATGARPCFVFPKADDVFALASEITWHQDEPFGSSSIFAQWCVFEAAKKAGVKVMLDGQGADEQLAGYHGCFPYYMASLAQDRQVGQLLRTVLERRLYHRTPIAPSLRQYVLPLLPRPARRIVDNLLPREAAFHHAPNWLDGPLVREHGNPIGALPLAGQLLDLPPIKDLRTLCITFTFASNLQLLLHWEDRNSMAHSVEARVPFVDHPLVELSIALGNDHKIVGGDTKRVLRRAMKGILPPAIRRRRDKLGFATPEQAWFRGPLRNHVMAGVEATLARLPGLFQPEQTRALVREMLDGHRSLDFTAWRIVNLGIWAERFNISS